MERHAGAVIVMGSTIFAEHAQDLVDRFAKARLPAIFSTRSYVELGGLMSYGLASGPFARADEVIE